jgi:general secretion pathway protein C
MRLRLPLARIVTVLLFAALCAIAAAWAIALLAPRPPVAPAGAIAHTQGPADLSAAAQLFGGVPQAVSADALAPALSNILVTGVLATTGRGVALLAIDGRPAKPFAVGETVTDGLRVRAITADAVELGRGGVEAPMRLAAPPRGSIAVLSRGPQSGGGGGATAKPAPSPPPPGVERVLPSAGAAASTLAPDEETMAAGALPATGVPLPRMPSLTPGLPSPAAQ